MRHFAELGLRKPEDKARPGSAKAEQANVGGEDEQEGMRSR